MKNNKDKYCVRRHMFFAVTNPIVGCDLSEKDAIELVKKLNDEELDSTYVHYEKHLMKYKNQHEYREN